MLKLYRRLSTISGIAALCVSMCSCGSKSSQQRLPTSTLANVSTSENTSSTTTTSPPVYGVGDPVQFNSNDGSAGCKVSVTGFIPTITDDCAVAGLCDTPAEGTQFVAVEISFENDSNGEQLIRPLQSFTLISSQGQQYNPQVLMSPVNQCDASFTGNKSPLAGSVLQFGINLIAGQSTTGCLVYEVPSDFSVAQVEFDSTPPSFWTLG